MTDRFSLRFEKGERAGEFVAITPPRIRLGRRPGNSLQIPDASVSGEHAELVIDDRGVLLRDLGSTNGTRVGGEKVVEVRLAHGDRILVGSVPFLFEDREFAGQAPAPPRASAGPGQEVGAVSAEKLARSGKRSRIGLVAAVVLLLVGGGAAALYFTGGKGGRVRKIKPVVSVPGNLVKGSAFEGELVSENWSSDESAPANFAQWGDARATGEAGMRAALDPDEWAVLASDPVAVSPGRGLELGASLRARGGARGRVGVELLLSRGTDETNSGSLRAWSNWVAEVTLHQTLEFPVPVPPGIRSARILVEARVGAEEGGPVDVDDVWLTAGSGAVQPHAKIDEYGLWLLGDPAQNMVLYKVSTPLVSDFHARGNDSSRVQALSFEAGDGDFRGSVSGATELSLRVEPGALADGLATIGEQGLQEHQPDFEREGVTDLLVSSENDLVALRLAEPVKVRGRSEAGGVRITIPLSGSSFRWQVDFREERTEAGNLAFEARKADAAGRLGECLAYWNRLLLEVPFEIELVNEARAVRSRLEEAGLIELNEVRERFEVAKFFRLVDLFRRCRADAERVGVKYGGSEVETKAEGLVADIEVALAGLEEDLNRAEIARLQSILKVLEATESPRLAGEVRSYLQEQYGVGN